MENMEKRMKEMEKSLKRTRMVLAALVVLVLAGGLMAAAGDDVKDVVRCNKLEMIGPDGETYASISKAPDGSNSLAFLDKNGTPRVGMGYNAVPPNPSYYMLVSNSKGIGSVGLAHLDSGIRQIGIMDNNGKARAGFMLTADESAAFVGIADQKGNPVYFKPLSALKTVMDFTAPQREK